MARREFARGEAARVVGSTGQLIPTVWKMSLEPFQEEILPYAPYNADAALEAPDYLAFLSFAYSTLAWLQKYRPGAESVDFWVECNGKISTRIGRMHEKLPGNRSGCRHASVA
jgi:hypothetical protein